MKKIDNHRDFYMITGVYGIHNKVSDKWYIGQSIGTTSYKGVGGRIVRHKWELKKGIHANLYLQRAYNKYKKQSFDYYLIEECKEEELTKLEQKYMDQYIEKLYNLCPLAGSTKGIAWTEERREKQSGKNHHMYGKNHTEETKLMISESRKGVTAGKHHHLYGVGHSEEAKKKMSESHKLLTGDKNSFFGKTHKEETKNAQRMTKLKQPPKPGKHKGVTEFRGKYLARIYIDRKLTSLGSFDDAAEAAKNYDFHAKRTYGDVYLNFPNFDYTDFTPRKTSP